MNVEKYIKYSVIGFIVSQLLFLYFNLINNNGTVVLGGATNTLGSILLAYVGIFAGVMIRFLDE